MMTTTRILSSMPGPLAENNLKIVDGALDKLLADGIQLKSRTKRPYKKRGKKTMGTVNTAVEETAKTEQTAPNYKLGVPQDEKPNTPELSLEATEYGFKIRENGDWAVAKKIFDIETLERKTRYNTFHVENVTEKAQLQEMDSARLLALVNLGLQKESLMKAKSDIGKIGNAKAVNDFVNNFRFLPQFDKITAGATEANKAEKRKEQTVAIMAFINTIPGLFDQLKEAAKTPVAKTESAETEDDNEDEDES